MNEVKDNALTPLDLSTGLAVTRTRLAADRTLLSWIRTSFAMITFGFGIIKFFQFFKVLHVETHSSGLQHTYVLGLFLILMGILILIPGYIEHRKTMQMLFRLDGNTQWSYASVVAVFVAIIGIFALFNTVSI